LTITASEVQTLIGKSSEFKFMAPVASSIVPAAVTLINSIQARNAARAAAVSVAARAHWQGPRRCYSPSS
jgi:hypothetical protein